MAKGRREILLEGKPVRSRGKRGIHKNYKVRDKHTSRHAKALGTSKGPVR